MNLKCCISFLKKIYLCVDLINETNFCSGKIILTIGFAKLMQVPILYYVNILDIFFLSSSFFPSFLFIFMLWPSYQFWKKLFTAILYCSMINFPRLKIYLMNVEWILKMQCFNTTFLTKNNIEPTKHVAHNFGMVQLIWTCIQ
jgi:hypothetical protein